MDTITVANILQRPLFTNAYLIAGKGGLQRRVRWVHILEVMEIESLIHGGEMILSTGVAFHKNEQNAHTYVKKLIERGAACFCLETNNASTAISSEIIALADTYHFPIIVFPNVVRFVDITQDIHAHIINQHHASLQQLDQLSKEFQQLTLNAEGNLKIVKRLKEATNAKVIYLPMDGDAYFFPVVENEEKERIRASVFQQFETKEKRRGHWYNQKTGETFLCESIEGMGERWGYVLISEEVPEASSSLAPLILDRVALALAQNLIRLYYTEEKKLHQEHRWIHELIDNRFSNEGYVRSLLPGYVQSFDLRLCVLELTTGQPDRSYQITHRIRRQFEKRGMSALMTIKDRHWLVILVVTESGQQHKESIQKIIEILKQQNFAQDGMRIGISAPFTQLLMTYKAYDEAIRVLRFTSLQRNGQRSAFYEDLGVYQLLFQLNDENLQAFIHSHLRIILEKDKQKSGELLTTLRAYLKYNCSKQQTAKALHIARQTLYYRLAKIEKLLGEDLAKSPEHRLAVEMALAAYDLNPNASR